MCILYGVTIHIYTPLLHVATMGHGGSKVKHFFKHDIGDNIVKAAKTVEHGVEHAAHDVGHFAEHAAHDVGHFVTHDVGGGIKHAANDVKHVAEHAAHDVKHFATHDVKHGLQDAGKWVEHANKDVVKEVNKVGKQIDKVPYIGKAITDTVGGIHSGIDNMVSGAVHGDWNRVGEGAIGTLESASGRYMAKQTNKMIDAVPGARTALGFVRLPGTGVSLGSLATLSRDGYNVIDGVKHDVGDGGSFDFKKHLVDAGKAGLRFGMSNITPTAIANMGTKAGSMVAGEGAKGIPSYIGDAIMGPAGSATRNQAIRLANSDGGKKVAHLVTGAVRNGAKNKMDSMLQSNPYKRKSSARTDTHPAQSNPSNPPTAPPPAKRVRVANGPAAGNATQSAPIAHDHRMQGVQHPLAAQPPQAVQTPQYNNRVEFPIQKMQQHMVPPTANQIMDPLASTLGPSVPFKAPPTMRALGRNAQSFLNRSTHLPAPDFPGLMTQEIIGTWMGNPAM